MGVVIIRELVGTSPKSWSDAARMAVATAARTVESTRCWRCAPTPTAELSVLPSVDLKGAACVASP